MLKKLCYLLAVSVLLSGCSAGADASNNETQGIAPAEYVQEDARSLAQEKAAVPEPLLADVQNYTGRDTAEAVEPLVYTVFHDDSGEAFSDSGTKVFSGRQYSTVTTTTNAAANRWLAEEMDSLTAQNQRVWDEIIGEAQRFYANFSHDLEDSGTEFYPYSYYVYASTARQDAHFLSIRLVSGDYRGGAHSNSGQTAHNFDLKNCSRLTLKDILIPGSRELLLEKVLESLRSSLNGLENMGLYSDYADWVVASILDEDSSLGWYFTSSGLAIFYNHYEIASFAAGILTVELRYPELEGILQPEYFPQLRLDSGDGFLTAREASGTTEIRIDLQPDEEAPVWEAVIAPQGTVYDVCIYAVASWPDADMPILGNQVFTANRLTEGEAVRIVSGDFDPGAYLVCYCTAQGETRTAQWDAEQFYEITVKNVN